MPPPDSAQEPFKFLFMILQTQMLKILDIPGYVGKLFLVGLHV
jgi:hypothetical protein